MAALNVVCLISGGKDSFFSILHCIANGHKIIALANLHPAYNSSHNSDEDLDSYMYQTIGHSVVPLYEKALSLPLYRQEIVGSAINQNKSYGPGDGGISDAADETEALMPLLRTVVTSHAEVNAVSTGAILSDYQRTRVESVATRLGLTPLSYLWQWPNLAPHSQSSLLEDMGAVGQDSRLIKVASGGLDESFLWQNVADSRTIARLDSAAKRFGSHDDGATLGEGGEYETLAISGPSILWKGRMVVHEDRRRIVRGDAGSFTLRMSNAEVQMNPQTHDDTLNVRIPLLLEPTFRNILDVISLESSTTGEYCFSAEKMRAANTTTTFESGQTTNVDQTATILFAGICGSGSDITEQTRSIMDYLDERLREEGHSRQDVVYTSIILRAMADFPEVNAVYGKYFQHANPPARVTVACASVLPATKQLMIAVTSVKNSKEKERTGLHVQSRSYWAPANIGPYSQAVSVRLSNEQDGVTPRVVFVAGQIPLRPASMGLPSTHDDPVTAFAHQTVLALQHLDRIGRAMQVRQWICAIVFVSADSVSAGNHLDKIVRAAWSAYHESEGDETGIRPDETPDDITFDVWHAKFGANTSFLHATYEADSQFRQRPRTPPPLYVVRVDALPRGSMIEWAPFALKDDGAWPQIPHVYHLLEVFKANLL